MGFRKPVSTLGGLNWWNNIKQNEFFIMQEHKVGVPVWPYKYRILMRSNRMEIANSNDMSEINFDWKYLQNNAVPQLEDKIDWLNDEKIKDIVTKIISTKIGKK
ncbi:hypothetical protein SAMN04515654_11520 [Halanaerobium congolense]|jgi:hypothetical protein|uniref:Uncharacterized protein n=1 Tax=Halanaerobium congolense TaxID=54121 RepID=A0A1G8NHK5_9FIRM|nr:hypothetical protein [Halanaerobium congolense]SDI79632.1 hypothetical protein SAMN04515654_11520 [Halanaerobium congolense]SET49135.1 hypothetical protein SAMN04515653_11621 [Halanaerobium congolense]